MQSTGNVTELRIYPIKSCGPVTLETMTLDDRGPMGDREYLVVDEGGKFVTQRAHPKMSLIKIEDHEDDWQVTVPDHGTHQIPKQATYSNQRQREARIWNDEVTCFEVAEDLSEAIGKYLTLNVKIVTTLPSTPRVRVKKGYDQNFAVRFPDSAPLLVCNTKTLDAIHKQLPTAPEIYRFRPNIICELSEDLLEERGLLKRIGEVDIAFAYRCERCVMINNRPGTGEPDMNLYKDLAKLQGGKVHFGMRAVHANTGTIRVGDRVQVINSEV